MFAHRMIIFRREPLQNVSAPPVVLESRNVLLVEDNRLNRRLMEDFLTCLGMKVTQAENGHEALLLIEQRRFDLILLDIRMPDIDGIEVARRIRSLEYDRSETAVPIIAITADSDSETIKACHNSGINALLAKPLIPEQLLKAIAAHSTGTLEIPSGGEPLLSRQSCEGFGNDPDRLRQYREMLFQDIDDELQAMQRALERDDRRQICLSAHSLKGLCGQLSNRRPVELAAWLQLNAPSASQEELNLVIDQFVNIEKQFNAG